MKTSRTRVLALLAGLALVATAGAAMAQENGGMPMQDSGHMPMQGSKHMEAQQMGPMQHPRGMHAMPATVTSADAASGLVEADAGGMALKVHFPPSAMKDLKPGDKITLRLAFTQP